MPRSIYQACRCLYVDIQLWPMTTLTPELPMGHDEVVPLVDDEAAILEMTKATLETHEFKVLARK
jgi:hypothetical protein